MKEAHDKAITEALKYEKEHPVPATSLITVVSIGILVILVPWAVEGLGFTEMGVLEGSWAASLPSAIGDVEACSFFSYLHRLGSNVGSKWRPIKGIIIAREVVYNEKH